MEALTFTLPIVVDVLFNSIVLLQFDHNKVLIIITITHFFFG